MMVWMMLQPLLILWNAADSLLRLSSRGHSGRSRRGLAGCRRSIRLDGQMLEPRQLLAVISMTEQEQLLLELVNRARANPTAEAALYGIDLNQDLEADEISPDPKQPLAPNQLLINAARNHADDMLAREFFDHVNPDGQGPSDRARAAGYPAGAGENIAWFGNPGFLERDEEVPRRHEALFLSPPHRTNMLNGGYRELGNGVRYGEFSRLNSIMVAESFGNRGGDFFVTGVTYADNKVQDDFYTIGESLASVTVTATRNDDGSDYSTTTGPSGGYALQVPAGVYQVTARGTGISGTITVSNVVVLGRNTKVDFNSRSSGLGIIGGVLFDDADRNGIRGSSESLLVGRRVYLDADDDDRWDAGETTLETDAQGAFRFGNLRPGRYLLRQTLPAGWQSSAPAEGSWDVELAAGENRSANFGSYLTNHPPIARADAFTGVTGRPLSMDAFGNDEDTDGELVLENTQIHVPPEHGTVVLNTNTNMLVYTPQAGYVGADGFEYSVTDDKGLSSEPARVSINVTPAVGTSWQNPTQPLDVNNDGVVSPLDALLVLNFINRSRAGPLDLPTDDNHPPPYLDVTGDAFVSPLDVLLVLNEVNRIAGDRQNALRAAAEGETPGARPVGDAIASAAAELAAAVDAVFEQHVAADRRGRRRSA